MSNEKTVVGSNAVRVKVEPWGKRLLDGTFNVVVGAVAGVVADHTYDSIVEAAGETGDPEVISEIQETAQVADDSVSLNEARLAVGVDDSMSFSQAFATARAEVGAGGVFVWRGTLYGTYYETEWNAMSAEDRAAYYASISPDISGEQASRLANHGAEPDVEVEHGSVSAVGEDPIVTQVDPQDGEEHGSVSAVGEDTAEVKILGITTDDDGTQYTSIEVGNHQGVIIGCDEEPVVAIIDIDDSHSITDDDLVVDLKTGESATVGEYLGSDAMTAENGMIDVLDDQGLIEI